MSFPPPDVVQVAEEFKPRLGGEIIETSRNCLSEGTDQVEKVGPD